MKKKKTSFYEKISTRLHFPAWLTPQIWLLLFVVILFFVFFLWSDPIATFLVPSSAAVATVAPTYNPNNPTPLPAEYYSNLDQTNSIVLGATVLVLIILVGTMIFFRKKW